MTAGAVAPTASEEPVGPATRVSVVWIAIFAMLAFGSGIAVSYGLAKDSPFWLIVGAGVFSPLVVIAAHSAAHLESSPRAAAAGAVCGLAVLAIVAVVVSTPWWDEDARAARSFTLAATDPSAHVYLRAEPEGRELDGGKDDPAPLVSGQRYRFSCVRALGDGTRWLRLDEGDYWVPASAMLEVPTTRGAPLPGC